MQNKLQNVRGMLDIMPETAQIHNYIKKIFYQIAENYGYKEIITPIIEYAAVFDRTLGLESDIISKEIYSFKDKKDRLLALRPEFTASIMRSVISNNLCANGSVAKLVSSGPLFRYDRPQKGRQRQFTQINAEHIGGVQNPKSDAELIKFATDILDNFEILKYTDLELNSIGCVESRAKYQMALQEYFLKYEQDLSTDSKKKIISSPMRILDSKDEKDKIIINDAPLIENFYSLDAQKYFEQVQFYLNELNINYKINKYLVRGLDYYCHTTFEFVTNYESSQNTILAGGRYDGLCRLMGGKENISGIGFAAGIERIINLNNFANKIKENKYLYIVPVADDKNINKINAETLKIASLMRKENISTIISDSNKNISKIMRDLNKQNATFILFIGEEEVKNSKYKLKNLKNKQEYFDAIKPLIKIINQ